MPDGTRQAGFDCAVENHHGPFRDSPDPKTKKDRYSNAGCFLRRALIVRLSNHHEGQLPCACFSLAANRLAGAVVQQHTGRWFLNVVM